MTRYVIRRITISATALELVPRLIAIPISESGLPTGIVRKNTDMFTFGFIHLLETPILLMLH